MVPILKPQSFPVSQTVMKSLMVSDLRSNIVAKQIVSNHSDLTSLSLDTMSIRASLEMSVH